MQLDDIVQDLKTKSPEELVEMLTAIRKKRVAAPEKTKQAAKKVAKTDEEKAMALLKSLSPEVLKSILEGQ